MKNDNREKANDYEMASFLERATPPCLTLILDK